MLRCSFSASSPSLNEQGTQLDFQALLIFSAVIGFAGSFISLAISKWSAKRLTGSQGHRDPLATPPRAGWSIRCNAKPRWRGIGMPEVAVYDSPDVNAFATGANRNKALVAVSTGFAQSAWTECRWKRFSVTRSATSPAATW